MHYPWETVEYDPGEGHDAINAFRLHLESIFPDGYSHEQHGECLEKHKIEDWKELASIPDAMA